MINDQIASHETIAQIQKLGQAIKDLQHQDCVDQQQVREQQQQLPQNQEIPFINDNVQKVDQQEQQSVSSLGLRNLQLHEPPNPDLDMQDIRSASTQQNFQDVQDYLAALNDIELNIDNTPIIILPDIIDTVNDIKQQANQIPFRHRVKVLKQVGKLIVLLEQKQQQPINEQDQELNQQQPNSNTITQEIDTREFRVIPFHNLYRFQQGMDSRKADFDYHRLKGAADKQYKNYRAKGMIDPYQQKPGMSLTQLFLNAPKSKNNLTEDQTRYFQSSTTPTEITTQRQVARNPTLNPDFCLSSTQFAIDTSKFVEFTDYEIDSHRNSVMVDYKVEQQRTKVNLNNFQLKARFAYRRNCRYFAMEFRKEQNIQYDETIAFYHANNVLPQQFDRKQRCTRASGLRDGNTTALMGTYFLFYGEDEQSFMDGYSNINRNIPPILTQDQRVKIYILDSQTPLSEPVDLPDPMFYEARVPIMSSWSTSSIPYFTDKVERQATSTIWLSGLYMPCLQQANCGMNGKAIRRMPKFCQADLNLSLVYYWNNLTGQWQEIVTPLEQRYAVECLKLENKAQAYGTMYHHTIERGETNLTRIKLSPTQKYGESRGVLTRNDFTYETDPFIDQVILGRFITHSTEVRQQMFIQYVRERCSHQLEWALRFQFYNPYEDFTTHLQIKWKPQGQQGSIYDAQLYPRQSPSAYDLILERTQRPPTKNYYINCDNWQHVGYIPKSLALNYDKSNDCYDRMEGTRYVSTSQIPQVRLNQYPIDGFQNVTNRRRNNWYNNNGQRYTYRGN